MTNLKRLIGTITRLIAAPVPASSQPVKIHVSSLFYGVVPTYTIISFLDNLTMTEAKHCFKIECPYIRLTNTWEMILREQRFRAKVGAPYFELLHSEKEELHVFGESSCYQNAPFSASAK